MKHIIKIIQLEIEVDENLTDMEIDEVTQKLADQVVELIDNSGINVVAYSEEGF